MKLYIAINTTHIKQYRFYAATLSAAKTQATKRNPFTSGDICLYYANDPFTPLSEKINGQWINNKKSNPQH